MDRRMLGKGTTFGRRLALLVLAVILANLLLSPAHAHNHTPSITIKVNGKTIKQAAPAFIDENNRLLVHSRSIAEAMGAIVQYDHESGRVEIRQTTVFPQYLYVRFFPNDRVITTGLVPGATGQEPGRYQLDTYARFVERDGYRWSYVPARIIPDVFNCGNWWDQSTWTFHIDCSKAAEMHQDGAEVVRSNPPTLHRDGYYYYDVYPMYPTTRPMADYLLQTANAAFMHLKDFPEQVEIRHFRASNMTRVVNPTDSGQIYATIKPDFAMAVLDEEQYLMLRFRMIVEKNNNAKGAAMVGSFLGLFVPGFREYALLKALAGSALLYEGTQTINENDIKKLETCMDLAKVLVRRSNQLSAEAQITVGFGHWGAFHCIPGALNDTLEWNDFERLGVKR